MEVKLQARALPLQSQPGGPSWQRPLTDNAPDQAGDTGAFTLKAWRGITLEQDQSLFRMEAICLSFLALESRSQCFVWEKCWAPRHRGKIPEDLPGPPRSSQEVLRKAQL